jgi:ribosomal-protein-alanine N-acetyltransferase
MMKSIDKNNLLLETSRITLRPLEETDITDEYILGLNDPEVNRYLLLRQPQTLSLVQEYVRRNWESPISILFGIFIKDDPSPLVGTIRISEIDFYHYLANVGVCLFAKRAWKKGYAIEAMREVVSFAFGDIGLHYLEAGAWSENSNSFELFRRAGFSETHRIKDKYRFRNEFKEAVYLGAVNRDFKESLVKNDEYYG